MKKLITRLMAIIALVALGSLSGKANQPFPKDGSPITSGTVYDVVMYQAYKATFTPEVSGTLIQDGCPELRLNVGESTYIGFGKFGICYTWQVEAGKTYTISSDFVMDSGNVSFTMEQDCGIDVEVMQPGPGEELAANANLQGEIYIRFNTAVVYDNASLICGNEEVQIGGNATASNSANVRITAAMNALYDSGALNPDGGDLVRLRIEGLQTTSGILYNGDGVLEIEYVAARKLVDLVSTNVPRYLKSYYPEGDPEGIWTFVFDRDVKNDDQTFLDITCGNPMSEDMFYYERLDPVIDGATYTFDLTGKVRSLEDYLMMQPSNYVAIKLNNVRDADGQLSAGDGPASSGSYSFSLDYEYIKPQAVACEFDPPSGTSLVGVDEIEIWYNNANLIDFEGVEFEYATESGMETAVVLKDNLATTVEYNEMTIRVKVPEVVKGKNQITVRLFNMKTLDGNTYQIEAYYDSFVVDLLSPVRAGEAIASTGDEDFVFLINDTSKFFYLRYDFYNAEGQDGWVYGTTLTKQSNGTWTAYNGNFTCYSNFNPYIVVSAYYNENDYNHGDDPAETYVFKFVGLTEAFEYSDVKFVSIDPEPFAEIVPSEDFCFTVVWDGLVKVLPSSGVMLGMGMGLEPFEKVEPVYIGEDPTEGYASIWMLYPSQYLLNSETSLDISIFAVDELGKVVEGNMGSGEYDYLQFSYIINSGQGVVDVSIDPEPYSVLNKLDKLVFSVPGQDLSLNLSYQGDVNPRLLDFNYNVVKEFSADEFVADNSDSVQKLQVTFDAITDEGLYTLYIPKGYFLIGDQFTVSENAEIWASYTVDGTYSGITSIINDADKHAIYNLQGIRLQKVSTPGLYIIDGKKVYIK